MFPSLIEMVRWHWSAMAGSWVTMRNVVPCSRFIVVKSVMTSSEVALSRFPVGSSHKMMEGRWTMARATATRCC